MVRAFDSHSKGHRFESCRIHKMKNKKLLLIVLVAYGLVLAVAPYSVYKFSHDLNLITPTLLFKLSFLLKTLALMAFPALALEIFMGSNEHWLSEKFGKQVENFHHWHGVFTYFLIFAHTFLLLVMSYVSKRTFDPFRVYTDFCLLCEVRRDLFSTFGKFAFWLISLGVVAAIFRRDVSFKTNWRLLHIMNYLAYIFVAVHAAFIGSNTLDSPYVFVYIASCLLFIYSPINKKVFSKNASK